MSSDRWYWAQRAQELRYAQLDIARRQAEAWRTGLAGVTTLLSAALVIGGRDDVTGLAAPYPVILILLFGAGLSGLVTATLLAVRAASGAPGDECLLTGEDLESWTLVEVRRVRRAIAAAGVLTVLSIAALAIGAGVSWLAPASPPAAPTVQVQSVRGEFCGQLAGLGQGTIAIGEPPAVRVIPLSSVVGMRTVTSCAPS